MASREEKLTIAAAMLAVFDTVNELKHAVEKLAPEPNGDIANSLMAANVASDRFLQEFNRFLDLIEARRG